MANRHRPFGLAAQEQAKSDSKYNPEEANRCRQWIEAVVQEPLVPGASAQPLDKDAFQEALKDGEILCKLLHKLDPSFRIPKLGKAHFQQMEAIEKFLTGCENYGLKKLDLFTVVDLYEGKCLATVVQAISALGSKAQEKGFDGPVYGPKTSTENVRNFTEEQLREGEKIIGLQMGTNKHANQAGMIMGKNRQIID